ncbi:MAG TPA: LPS assembly lipoprotein LptE [Kiloniellales bacterium]|nr:LPS assembly lipoprotein LptE [Kiloniellales bacterium]
MHPAWRLATALSFGFALVLAGCGFRSLYGDFGAADAARPDPNAQMAQVRIAPLPDRIGQQMHNLLRDRLNSAGQPRDPRYRLRVRLHESTESLAIRRDETATRANLTITADFALEELASREVVLEGQASSINSYNILTSQFATYNAERDARERSLRELSDDIRTRLGLYFSRARAAAP